MIQKVNSLTIFKNYFTPTGIVANEEIKNIRSFTNECIDIYQKNLPNGQIALQTERKYQDTKKTTTLFLNPVGIQNIIKRESRNTKEGFKLVTILKKYLPGSAYHKKQVFYNTKSGKIEEKANKYYGIGKGSTLTVKSYGGRESEFPATQLGGSIHPTIAHKIDYENGDVGYTEMYPNL